MQELRDLAQSDLIGDFVEKPPRELSIEHVSGVSLKIDEYWLGWFGSRYAGPFWSRDLQDQRLHRMFFGMRYDFSDRPPDWQEHCRRKGYVREKMPKDGAHPVSVVVILRRPLKQIYGEGYPRFVGPHPIVYELRAEAEGYSLRGGDYVGGSKSGTLGGFLWHTNDLTYYALSCAHVLGDASSPGNLNRAYSPKPNAFGAKVEIGNVTWSEMPPSKSTSKCNSRTDPNAPTIDVAIAEIDGPTLPITPNLIFPNAGKITQWTPIANIGQGDPTSFCGYASGTVNAKVKEATIWKELTLNGTPYCFKDLFVLEDIVFRYVTSALAKHGDSGAWVVNSTSSVVSWDGMLIGGDGVNAYCCYAENIMQSLPDSHLVLPP